jgi:hypothetical protein
MIIICVVTPIRSSDYYTIGKAFWNPKHEILWAVLVRASAWTAD